MKCGSSEESVQRPGRQKRQNVVPQFFFFFFFFFSPCCWYAHYDQTAPLFFLGEVKYPTKVGVNVLLSCFITKVV